MKDFEKILGETKTQINSLLTKDSPKEVIDQIAKINQQLEIIKEAYTEQKEENQSLKETIINQVQGTGFQPSNSKDDSGVDQNQKSMDEIMQDELNKIIAKQSK